MLYAFVPFLGLLLARLAFAQPPSEPSHDQWKKVFQTEVQVRLQRPVYALAFSPDGKLLAGCLYGDPENHFGGQIRVWDVATGKERPVKVAERPRSPKSTEIQSLIYSPAGNLFAIGKQVGNDKPTLLWEVSTGKELPALEGTDFSIKEVSISPDAKFIAVFGSRLFSNPPGYRVRVFEASSKKELFEVPADMYGPRFVAFLPDNKTLIVPAPKGVLEFWDVATGKKRGQSPAIGGYPFALALQGKAVLADGVSGKVITAEGGTDKLSLFDLETGKRRATFEVGRISRLPSLSADGTVMLVAGVERDGRTLELVVDRWDLSTGRKLGRFRADFTDAGDQVRSVALSPDGQKLAIGTDNNLSLWIRDKAPGEK